MGYRQYAIYIASNTDAPRKQEKNIGCSNWCELDINVGSSNRNSYHLATVYVERNHIGNDDYEFQLKVDGKVIKEIIFNNKTKEFRDVISETVNNKEYKED